VVVDVVVVVVVVVGSGGVAVGVGARAAVVLAATTTTASLSSSPSSSPAPPLALAAPCRPLPLLPLLPLAPLPTRHATHRRLGRLPPQPQLPRQSGAKDRQRLAAPRGRLEKRVALLVERAEDLVHEGALHAVGLVGEGHVEAGDAADGEASEARRWGCWGGGGGRRRRRRRRERLALILLLLPLLRLDLGVLMRRLGLDDDGVNLWLGLDVDGGRLLFLLALDDALLVLHLSPLRSLERLPPPLLAVPRPDRSGGGARPTVSPQDRSFFMSRGGAPCAGAGRECLASDS
jgi:hypothetical protein